MGFGRSNIEADTRVQDAAGYNALFSVKGFLRRSPVISYCVKSAYSGIRLFMSNATSVLAPHEIRENLSKMQERLAFLRGSL